MREMEIVHPALPRGPIRHALFDFDGTLSLIRSGWREVMIDMGVELLSQTPRHESEPELRRLVVDLVDRLTGQQTIYQMLQLAAEIEQRGGPCRDAADYKRLFAARLQSRIDQRLAALRSGRLTADDLMVPGAYALLQALRARRLTCYLASGTDEPCVRDEAGALGLTPYFAAIHGARADYATFSKKMLLDRILAGHALRGDEIVVFGDGSVEIADAKTVGAVAVGVASDEAARGGLDQRKRAALLQAGADIIIPDFREHAALLRFLFPS